MKEKPTLLYLHGFNSSALSEKAQIVKHYVQKNKLNCNLCIPELAEWPESIAEQLLSLTDQLIHQGPIYIIGSSLGGFFGTWLMESLLSLHPKYCVKLALINPAVEPWSLLDSYLGTHVNKYTGKTIKVTSRHSAQLRQLQVETLTHLDNILLLLQTGDTTLDYNNALTYYADCPMHIEEGGNHEFERFDKVLPMILQFFNPRLAIFD